MLPLLQIKNLSISFKQDKEQFEAVKNISFDLQKGKITALTGESGSGKSLTALSFMQLLPQNAVVSGELLFGTDHPQNLLSLSFTEMKALRGNKISMIFQEPMTSLNPVKTCGAQVMESLIIHKKISKQAAKRITLELFEKVELPEPVLMLKKYPHQISGGQKQRVMIAMAMSCDPVLLIADEPTTALDVRVQKNILDLLKKLQEENELTMLLITHDLAVVADYADELIVMNKGVIVEKGETSVVLSSPKEDYTKLLLNARVKPKALIVDRWPLSDELLKEPEVVLEVKNLSVDFPKRRNIFGKTTEVYKAVNDVSFCVNKNETLGLVGESGCGKTTLGRSVLQLIRPTAGEIIFHGKNISEYNAEEMRVLRKDMQIVFQDPYGSLNPRMTIGEAITEPIGIHFPGLPKRSAREKTAALLEQVKLSPDSMNRYPFQFSGGQRQRICIARALALDPSFLVFDESVSALDLTVQAQVLDLINELKAAHSFSSIFISHDLSVIRSISDRVMVMQQGRIVEEGSPEQIFSHPQENYTKELLASLPGRKLAK